MGWKVDGRFKREGTYVYLRLIHVDVGQKSMQHCKAIILQIKINFKIKFKKVWGKSKRRGKSEKERNQ